MARYYYISFGQNSNMKDSLMEIQADSKEEARDKFIEHYKNTRFCSCYTEEEKESYCSRWPTTIVELGANITYYD